MQPVNRKVIIDQLDALLRRLAQTIEQAGELPANTVIFDNRLFRLRATDARQYLAASQALFLQLQRGIALPENRFQWLTTHLIDQCQALSKALNAAAQPVRPHSGPDIRHLIRKTQEYKGYEQRLTTMMTDQQQQLTRVTHLGEQQERLKQLALTEQRLLRCQQALKQVEWQRSCLFARPGRNTSG